MPSSLFGNPHVLNMSMSVQDATLEGCTEYRSFETLNGGPWPLQSKHACWHCCHAFSCRPVGVPVDDNITRFRLTGNFCSIECALAWAISTGNHHTDHISGARVKNMGHILLDLKPQNIRAAPDRLCLAMFGGPLSIEEFRRNNCKYSVIGEPFVSSHMLLCVEKPSAGPPDMAAPAHEAQSKPTAQQAERRFCVTGLRRPTKPLPVAKVLCEQDVETRPGEYDAFVQQKLAQKTTDIVSRGDGGGLSRFLKKK